MTLAMVQVEVAKETHEAFDALASGLGKLKVALADGWQLGDDAAVLLEVLVSDVIPAVNGLGEIPEEIRQGQGFYEACGLGAAKVLGVLLAKAPAKA